MSVAETDLDRAQQLVKRGTISSSEFEAVVSKAKTARAAVEQARAEVSLRQSQLASARARLVEPGQSTTSAGDNCCLPVYAPVSGTVIKVIVESAQVVAAGTPLLEIGDPDNMEIVVHLLSTDAVDIEPGMDATIDGWGGPALAARVTRVDPAAYTKVSALGIEEQRVDTTLDLVAPPAEWQGLGHDFRVVAHIVTWRSDGVVTVPLGALFRNGSTWTVYRVDGGRAVSTPVEIGHRNDAVAEVVKGLAKGDSVVLHPSDRVGDGVRVAARQ